MRKLLAALFSDSGDVSMMRVMAFIVCLTGCYIAISRGPEELGVISVLLTTAFGGKFAQKAVEVKRAGSGGSDVDRKEDR